MKGREEPGWAIRYFGPLPFLFGAVGALVWFFYRQTVFFDSLSSDIVVVEKGSFYSLGVGVGLLALTAVCIQEFWARKVLSKRQSSVLSKLAIIGVILTFTVPHLLHFAANNFLKNNGYAVCTEASHQWLFFRDIVYLQESVPCRASLTMIDKFI